MATFVGFGVQFKTYQRADSELDSGLHHDESIVNALILICLVYWDKKYHIVMNKILIKFPLLRHLLDKNIYTI